MREVLSTARPTPLRLAGFLALAAGAVVAGIGATRDWAIVGFPEDRTGAVDVSYRGTDVWEGKVVLLVAVGALLAMLAIRLASAASTRSLIAGLLILFGLVCAALPLVDAARAADRFGGGGGLDRIAESLALERDLPEDEVRELLERRFGEALRVDVEAGLWSSAAGGVLLVAGGALSVAWASRRRAPGREPRG